MHRPGDAYRYPDDSDESVRSNQAGDLPRQTRVSTARARSSGSRREANTISAGDYIPGIAASPADAAWEPREEVDVEAVLTNLSSKNPQKLNWKTSIVDLMKLLDIDSSLANRKELARELGYPDDMSDSAAMNVWLHRRVMQELQRSGGKVPPSLMV